MARGSRGLRNLDIEALDAEPEEGDEEAVTENEDVEEEDLQMHHIDNIVAGLPQQPAQPIKIIWPNGEVRQVVGDFRVSNLLELRGGKVIVGTDEHGVPNERSASILGQYLGDIAESQTFPPLDIPRWDNKLFGPLKVKIIKDVEAKFAFPAEMKLLSRHWIFRSMGDKWRSYKSKLKKQHFNPDVRSLEEIIKGHPRLVNSHQWRGLVGIWFSEAHKKLCATNSRCAKQQKNPHTTGRKSHARLKKEMEDQRKGKIQKIELFDASHKKKDGNYINNNVKTIMDTLFDELAKRKEKNNGHLSAKDYAEGPTFACQSEEELRTQARAEAAEKKVAQMSEMMNHWLAVLRQKFPEEDRPNGLQETTNDKVDTAERVGDNTSEHNSQSKSDSAYNINDNNLVTNAYVHSPTHSEQRSCSPRYAATEEVYAQSSLPCEHIIAKNKHIENHTQVEKGYEGADLPRHSLVINQGSRRVRPCPNPKKKVEVYLFSLRSIDKVVAKGHLVTMDKTKVIFGNMLGSGFCGVYVEGLENLTKGNTGEEMLPRPHEQIRTIRDAIGFVIAWPRTHVKRLKCPSQTGKNLQRI